jgi:hypothetical protein
MAEAASAQKQRFTHPTAEQNRAVMKVPYVGMKAAITLNTAFTPSADKRVLRRPIRSDKLPHTTPPTIMPRKVMPPATDSQDTVFYGKSIKKFSAFMEPTRNQLNSLDIFIRNTSKTHFITVLLSTLCLLSGLFENL